MRLDYHYFYRLWDLLITAIMAFVAIEVPEHYVLEYNITAHPVVYWLVTLVLCVDVFVQWYCIAPQLVSPVEHSRRGAIAPDRGWLIVDLVAAIPFRVLPGGELFELLRLLKLARIAQLMRRWQRQAVQNAQILRLVFFVCWLFITAHWLACGWLAIGGIDMEADDFSKYLRALYWCITTLATVGYGDIVPKTNLQTVYNMVVMLLGVGVYGYVIGNVTNLVANMDLAKTHYREKMERLGAFMRYRNIPPILQRRLRDYHAYLWENRLGYDESSVLADLPDSLRTEVAVFLRRDFIERAPLFQGASHELVREMALQLRPVVFTPGDFIFRAGQYGYNMYFISRGTVEIIAPDGTTVLTALTDGQFFGELALLFSQPRTASVRAVDYCDLYTLDKDTFDQVLTRYPEFAAHIKEVADERNPQTTQA
jgi:Cyclic nucleotide-binding domain/Ion transport protein